ncbi:MAG: hypothetical protein JW806_07665 [Sedimentisphaerales bacterium]|nr:hypothetical protein [Sedimentisphaerales bacterium]
MNIGKILKKHVAIIPASIAIVAILLFIPTTMMRKKISQKLAETKKLGADLESTIKSAIPVEQAEAIRSYEDMHQNDANSIQQLAAQTTQRELLSYKIFPDTNETSVQIFHEFRRAYEQGITQLINDMNALDAPTDIEIWQEAGSTQTGGGSSLDTSGEKIFDLMCEKRSKEISVYANPTAFSGYGFWNNWRYRGPQNAIEDCWYCQLAYWIHKDVADTIISINSGSDSVANSSVKRLISVKFQSSDAISDETTSNFSKMPIYDAGSSYLCNPWTGRKTNNQIDIIPFSMAVIIRADDILKFMEQLCSEKEHYFSGYRNDLPRQLYKHNQITILKSNIESVQEGTPDSKRYYYGQDTIVYLNLVCEYIFNKEGYEIIKPESVKKEIDVKIKGNKPKEVIMWD